MNKISVNSLKKGVKLPTGGHALIKQAVNAVLKHEGVAPECLVYVHIADNSYIREVNRDTRQIDEATDVLSFPMLELRPGDKPRLNAETADPQTGLIYLGDVLISLEKVVKQAADYGHSFERELTYLTVHSVLHLLGYDHTDEGPQKAEMRGREEEIMGILNITKEPEN